jgi:hypothetical protein
MQGTFITTVSFAPEGGIRCCPDGFSVVDTIMTNAVEGTIALVATCPRLILTRSFVPFYETQPSGLNLSNTIRLVAFSQSQIRGIELPFLFPQVSLKDLPCPWLIPMLLITSPGMQRNSRERALTLSNSL